MRIINIKGCDTCKQVLLFINRNADDGEWLQLIAWHETEDGWLIQVEAIESEDAGLLERMLTDFSESSANEFANSMKF